jgi:radial spoke head protein 4A
LQDLHTDFDSLKWAGTGFGDGENFRIQAAMRGLADKLAEEGGSLSSLRFWGKVLGTKKDYLIMQGEYSGGDGDLPEEGEDYEMGRSGPNRFTYWASNGVGSEFIRLPCVSASEIRSARQLRRFFTGDLEADVLGHPPFRGKEKNFLRAQIARITADCSLAPAGFFTMSEDGSDMAMNEEFAGDANAEALANAGAWECYHAAIGPSGRCAAWPVADEEGNIPEVEPPAMLRSVEEASFKVSAPMNNKVCLRSNVWPGASVVGFGKVFSWCYTGWGQAAIEGSYAPTPPAAPQMEFSDEGIKEAADVTVDPTPPAEEEAGDEEGAEE